MQNDADGHESELNTIPVSAIAGDDQVCPLNVWNQLPPPSKTMQNDADGQDTPPRPSEEPLTTSILAPAVHEVPL